jgi:hypothetical protein
MFKHFVVDGILETGSVFILQQKGGVAHTQVALIDTAKVV